MSGREDRSLGVDRLTLAEAAAIIDAATRDKSYRVSSLGQLVGRYLRWFRNEWGATDATLRDYESVLAKMSLRLAHLEPLEVDVEDLRAVIDDYWGDASARTRQKVTSVVRAFWAWVESESLVPFSPASRLKRPRAPRRSCPRAASAVRTPARRAARGAPAPAGRARRTAARATGTRT